MNTGIRKDDSSDARRSALIAHGWQKQGSFDEPRLSDVIETYREMGWEVLVEAYDPILDAENGACNVCMRAASERMRTVFTRKTD